MFFKKTRIRMGLNLIGRQISDSLIANDVSNLSVHLEQYAGDLLNRGALKALEKHALRNYFFCSIATTDNRAPGIMLFIQKVGGRTPFEELIDLQLAVDGDKPLSEDDLSIVKKLALDEKSRNFSLYGDLVINGLTRLFVNEAIACERLERIKFIAGHDGSDEFEITFSRMTNGEDLPFAKIGRLRSELIQKADVNGI